MRILVVTPWAPSARRPRSLGLIEHLAVDHEVHVVGSSWSKSDDAEYSRLNVASVTTVRLRRIPAMLRAAVGLILGRSLQQSYLDSYSLKRLISKCVEIRRPELLYFNVIRTAGLVVRHLDIPRVLDLDEFRSAYYDQMSMTSASRFWRVVARIEAKRLKLAEARALIDFDVCFVSSPRDLDSQNESVVLVRSPHALSSPTDCAPILRRDGVILFVGRLGYRANSEALTWFVSNVMPGVVARVAHARLVVVGAEAGPNILKLGSISVDIVGAVPDVTDFYRQAEVSVVPVRMATGVQMKLIESLCLGTLAVATPIVASGAGVIDKSECFVADSAEEWICTLSAILLKAVDGEAVAAQGLRWAQEHYDVSTIFDRLDAILMELSIQPSMTGTRC